MSTGNSGTGDFSREAYRGELAKTRHVLDTVEVAGLPKRDGELAELRRLVKRHPDEARAILDEEP